MDKNLMTKGLRMYCPACGIEVATRHMAGRKDGKIVEEGVCGHRVCEGRYLSPYTMNGGRVAGAPWSAAGPGVVAAPWNWGLSLGLAVYALLGALLAWFVGAWFGYRTPGVGTEAGRVLFWLAWTGFAWSQINRMRYGDVNVPRRLATICFKAGPGLVGAAMLVYVFVFHWAGAGAMIIGVMLILCSLCPGVVLGAAAITLASDAMAGSRTEPVKNYGTGLPPPGGWPGSPNPDGLSQDVTRL